MKKLMQDIKQGKTVEGFRSFFHRKHLPLIGYLILVVALAITFYRVEQDRAERRTQFIAAIAVTCERLNEQADRDAEAVYTNYIELPQNAKVLGIKLTPELRNKVIRDSNRKLKGIIKEDCRRTPDQPRIVYHYRPIILGKPLPKLTDTTQSTVPR